MPATINLEALTDEEIGELGTRCLDALNLADKVQAVVRAFRSEDEREELKTWLEPEPEEEDEDADLGDESEEE